MSFFNKSKSKSNNSIITNSLGRYSGAITVLLSAFFSASLSSKALNYFLFMGGYVPGTLENLENTVILATISTSVVIFLPLWIISLLSSNYPLSKNRRLQLLKQKMKMRHFRNNYLWPYFIIMGPLLISYSFKNNSFINTNLIHVSSFIFFLLICMYLEYVFHFVFYERLLKIYPIERLYFLNLTNKLKRQKTLKKIGYYFFEWRVDYLNKKISELHKSSSKKYLLKSKCNFMSYYVLNGIKNNLLTFILSTMILILPIFFVLEFFYLPISESEGIIDLVLLFFFGMVVILPALYQVLHPGWKGYLYSYLVALVMCCLMISYSEKITTPFLIKHHHIDYSDRQLFFKGDVCDILKSQFVLLDLIKGNKCSIKNKYKTLNSIGKEYLLHIYNGTLLGVKIRVKKKDAFPGIDLARKSPKSDILFNVANQYNEMYHLPIRLIVHNQGEYEFSHKEHFDNATYSLKKNKGLYLGYLLQKGGNLIDLDSRASLIDTRLSDSKSIEDRLVEDGVDNAFYYKLIEKLRGGSQQKTSDASIKELISVYESIVKNEELTNKLIALGDIQKMMFSNETVLKLEYKKKKTSLIFLYIPKVDMTFGISSDQKQPYSFDDHSLILLVEKLINIKKNDFV